MAAGTKLRTSEVDGALSSGKSRSEFLEVRPLMHQKSLKSAPHVGQIQLSTRA